MKFTESNTVERMILDTVTGTSAAPWVSRDRGSAYGSSLGRDLRPARWDYVPGPLLPRGIGDVMVEPWVRVSCRFKPTGWSGPMRTSWHGSGARRPCPLAQRASM